MKLLEEMQMVEEMEKSLSAGNRDKRTSNKSGNRLKKSIIRGGKKLQDEMRAKENAEIKSKVFAAHKKYIIPAFEKQGFINVMVGPQFSYEIDAEY